MEGGTREWIRGQDKTCMKNNCSLTPLSDSRGSALTRTAGIPSSINILLLMASASREREKKRKA